METGFRKEGKAGGRIGRVERGGEREGEGGTRRRKRRNQKRSSLCLRERDG